MDDGLQASSTTTPCLDDDGDLSEEEGDCDDYESATFPGNTEIADGVDNDCDTYIDEGTPFFDDDGDCYCESAPCYGSVNANCALAQLADGDCDDNDDNISPDLVWYADSDGDLRGNPNNSMTSCTQPFGYVSNSQDCDDTSAYAWTGNPGPVTDTTMIVMELLMKGDHDLLSRIDDLWFEYGHDRGMFTAAKLCFDCRRL